MEKKGHSPTPAVVGHEKIDVHAPSIIKFAVGLAVTIAASMLLMAWLFGYFGAHQPAYAPPASLLVKGRQIPPGPLLEVNEGPPLQQLVAQENETLNSYGWVDKQTGVVRISIDRAMSLLLRRGLPTRGEATAPLVSTKMKEGRK